MNQVINIEHVTGVPGMKIAVQEMNALVYISVPQNSEIYSECLTGRGRRKPQRI